MRITELQLFQVLPPSHTQVSSNPESPGLGNSLTENAHAQTLESRKRLLEDNCLKNPFCFDKGFSTVPYVSLGYEAIFGESRNELLNLRTRLFFQNGKQFFDRSDDFKSFGIGPDLQFHASSMRIAASAGVALRMFGITSGGAPDVFGWAGLSARLGAGHLTINDADGNLVEGTYRFFAADIDLSFLGFYVGGGMRKEFWPQTQDKHGKYADSKGSHIYPAFNAGFGLF